MKLITLFFLGLFTSPTWAQELITTPSTFLIVKSQCAEGNMVCNNVDVYQVDRKTGQSTKYKGKTLNRPHSYSFYGYQYQNNQILFHQNTLIRNIKTKQEKTEKIQSIGS